MYYVYIIQSLKTGRFYTGLTENFEKRLSEHNHGKSSTNTTMNKGPFRLIHVEITVNRIDARKLEKYFKSGAGREIRSEIIGK